MKMRAMIVLAVCILCSMPARAADDSDWRKVQVDAEMIMKLCVNLVDASDRLRKPMQPELKAFCIQFLTERKQKLEERLRQETEKILKEVR
jgi:hypothetical protein